MTEQKDNYSFREAQKKARVSLNSRKSECNSVQKNKFEKKQENFYPELCLFLAERRKIWEKITWKNLDAGDRVSVASMGQILASGRRKRRRRRKQKRFPRLKCGRNERKKQRAPENRACKSVLYTIFLWRPSGNNVRAGFCSTDLSGIRTRRLSFKTPKYVQCSSLNGATNCF